MTRTLISLLLVLIASAAKAGAQQPAAPTPPPPALPFEGAFTIGAIGSDTLDYLGRVGEYDLLRTSPRPALTAQFWGERDTSRFDFSGRFGGDARDQRYRLDVNMKRRVKVSVAYDRMPHRLDHDPLSWMDASSNLGGTFVVGHTDNDPGAQYELTRGDLRSRVEWALPFARAGNVVLYASHRQELRDGVHQVLTTEHCATCHTESYSRPLNQQTRDLTGGAKFQSHALTVDYSYMDRRFSEREATPTNIFSRALQPATLQEVFLNRVQYDERAGAVPIDTVPGLRKRAHDLRARVSLGGNASLYGTFTQSDARNLDTRLTTNYTGGSGRLFVPFGKTVSLRASVRRYDIDADSVFVDVNEQVAPAGLSAGRTYAEAFPQLGSVDFVRESGLSRTPTNLQMDLTYQPRKRTTLRAGYEWEEVKREHFEVHRTVTNIVRGSVRSSPSRQLQYQGRVTWRWTRDPFAAENAAMPLVLQPSMSPGNVPFTGLQYFEFYRTRQATLTSAPLRDGVIEQSATWTPNAHVSISGSYRYRRGINDELNFSQWSQSAHVPGAQLWFAPGGNLTIAAGYTYQRQRTETGFATLAFVG